MKSDMSAQQLVQKYGLISDQVDTQELLVILTELQKILDRPGSIVEFGCYRGTTSLYIKRVLAINNQDDRSYHVYDSFEGLPEKVGQDESPLGTQFIKGELFASKKQFIDEFKKARLSLPVIHKGWFDELGDQDVPDNIRFAFLDGDYYKSIKSSFFQIEKKLAKGAVIIVDDYVNQSLPGAARAVDEWCLKKGVSIQTIHSLAVIKL